MRQKIEGVKNRAAALGEISRQTQAVKEERKYPVAIRGVVEKQVARIERDVIDLPTIQFGEKRTKPTRMLVEIEASIVVVYGELSGRNGRKSLHERKLK